MAGQIAGNFMLSDNDRFCGASVLRGFTLEYEPPGGDVLVGTYDEAAEIVIDLVEVCLLTHLSE